MYTYIATYVSVSCSPCKSLVLRKFAEVKLKRPPNTMGPWRQKKALSPFSATLPRPLCPAEHGDIPARLHSSSSKKFHEIPGFTSLSPHLSLCWPQFSGGNGAGRLQKGQIEDLQIEDGHLAGTLAGRVTTKYFFLLGQDSWFIDSDLYVYPCVYVYIYIHTCIDIYIYTHMYIYILLDSITPRNHRSTEVPVHINPNFGKLP